MHTPLVTRKRQTRNCETRSPTPGNTRSWECPRAGPLFTVGMWPPGRKGGTAHSTSEGLPKGPSGVCTSHGGQLGHGEGRVGYLVGLWLMWGVSCSLRVLCGRSGLPQGSGLVGSGEYEQPNIPQKVVDKENMLEAKGGCHAGALSRPIRKVKIQGVKPTFDTRHPISEPHRAGCSQQ